MWITLLILVAIVVALAGLVVLERLEFLSVFPRLRRRQPSEDDTSGSPPAH